MDRRQFIKLGLTSVTALAGGSLLASCAGPASEPEQSEEPTTNTNPTTPDPAPTATTSTNALVVYYSHPETTASSDPANLNEEEENSVVVVDGEILGNTQYVAQIIAREAGAGIHRIEIAHEYPVAHDALIEQAQQELNSGFRPEITGGIPDLSAYDVVFFGYPIWWGELPPAVTAFLEQADFGGKDVYLFNTHGGSGDAGTPATIKALQNAANVSGDNYVASRDVVADAEPEIVAWVDGLGLSNQA